MLRQWQINGRNNMSDAILEIPKKVRKVKQRVVKTISISMENTKIGKIPSFSLPALDSCPGKTTWCEKACYAAKIERVYRCAKKAYDLNFELVKGTDFVATINEELTKLVKKGITTFRLHVSGDFYDVRYIYNWLKIVKANPTITFFGYTHSWSVLNLLPHLGILRAQPNVILFASTDESTVGNPPKNWRIAHAGDSSTNPHPKMIKCLEQIGKVKDCAACKICFNHASTINIQFKVH